MNNLIELYTQTPELYSSGNGNAVTWIIMIVFFGIIIALIIIAAVGSRKDKIERLIEADKNTKTFNTATKERIVIFTSINKLINTLESELKDFKPSVGTKSLGDINKEYSDIIRNIASSTEYKELCKNDDFKNELKPIIDELRKTKPSNWEKEASFATNLIKVKFEALNKNKDNAENVKLGEVKEWKK